MTNTAVPCPVCKKPLTQAWRLEENRPWKPNVRKCRRCEIKVYEWIVFSYGPDDQKNLMPLNSFEFEHAVKELEKFEEFSKEGSLVVTESTYHDFKSFWKLDGLDLILFLYEHYTKHQTKAFN
ncbi:MAG: hypothetical protein U5L75_01810 [Candidatus Campbellbacteria bacterium]|nr:hypothetical protein [Candidatus Campbellbacteria bacterium]